jgi:hypothetical protein
MNKDQTDVSHIDKEEINEPVALRYDFDGNGYLYMDAGSGSDWASRVKDSEFLYTHPQKELTDEEIINTLDKICYEGDSGCVTGSVTIFHQTIVNFARAILKKASEK